MDNRLPKILPLTLLLGLLCSAISPIVATKEYLAVGTYGNDLHIIDPANLSLLKTIEIPGSGSGPSFMVTSPDGNYIYLLSNAWSSLIGIEIDSGKQVFRADMNTETLMARGMFGLAIHPNGSELYIVQTRTQKHRNYYEVLPPQVAVYSTDGGLNAKPIRSFTIPRHPVELAVSKDGKSLYVYAHDIHRFDIASGQLEKTYPVLNWQRTDITPPDKFNVWGTQNYSDYHLLFYYGFDSRDPNTLKFGYQGMNVRDGYHIARLVDQATSTTVAFVVNPNGQSKLFGVGDKIFKIDLASGKVEREVAGGQLWQTAKISKDGTRLFTGGGRCNIGVWSTADLSKLGNIVLPNCADQADSTLLLFEN